MEKMRMEETKRLVEQAGVERLRLVPVKRGVIKLVGKDGTGKTNLKRSFQRMKFNSEQTSTGAIEVEILLQHEGSSEWTSLKGGNVQEIAKSFLKQMAERAAATAHAASLHTNTHDKKLEEQLRELLKRVELLAPRAIIQVCDHGGQENLIASFAQFVASNFIYIMTFDVSQPLEAKAHSSVRSIAGGELQCSPVKLHHMKYNIDWINYHLSAISVSSVSTQQQPSDGSFSQGIGPVFGCASPPVIFAATHADKIAKREAEVMRSQEVALQRVLRNKKFTRHVHRRPTDTQSKIFRSELCFCIDNTISHPPNSNSQQESDDNEDPELILLRQLVTSKIEKHCTTYLTPVTYLLLEDKVYEMRTTSKQDKIISFEEMVVIALDKCSMKSRNEVKDALSYLHNFSVVVHFAECRSLQQVVFIDAPWVYTTLSRLNPICVSDLPAIVHHDLDTLHKEGIMSQQLANHLLPDITDKDRTRMLEAAEQLDIVSSLKRKCEDSAVGAAEKHIVEYLVPSALRVDDEEVVDVVNDRRGVASPIPLVLRPDNVGMFIEVLFFRLVNRCIREYSLESPRLRRNRATFHLEDGCDIDLLYVYHYLIVMVKENPKLSDEEVRKSCIAARTFIDKALEEVKQQGLAGFNFSVCFQHLTSADEKFFPINSDRLVSLKKYPNLFYPDSKRVHLAAEQKSVDVWFEPASRSGTGTAKAENDPMNPQLLADLSAKADAKPDPNEIVEVASDVSGIWEKFAAVLDPQQVTPDAVRVIKKENEGDAFSQSWIMLRKWCDSKDTQATRRMLIQTLCSRHIGYKSQAVKVFRAELVDLVIRQQQK